MTDTLTTDTDTTDTDTDVDVRMWLVRFTSTDPDDPGGGGAPLFAPDFDGAVEAAHELIRQAAETGDMPPLEIEGIIPVSAQTLLAMAANAIAGQAGQPGPDEPAHPHHRHAPHGTRHHRDTDAAEAPGFYL